MPLQTVRRVKVSLELFALSVSALVSTANRIFASMTGNLLFPSPSIPLSVLMTAITDLANSIPDAQTGGKEQHAQMRANRLALIKLLTNLGAYVENIANAGGDEAAAVASIMSAGMNVKRFSPRQKQGYTLSAGKLSGTVYITAEAVKRGTHEWQYTLTPADPASWLSVPPTTKAHTTVTGLTSGSNVSVRHLVVLKSGPSGWDAVLSVIVP